MNCFLCDERPAANKHRLCHSCFVTHWNNEFWTKRRAEHAARQEAIARQEAEERRTFLNMYRGAQNALKRLQKRRGDVDYSSALKQCRERIEALENTPESY